ncbi:MAG: ABC-type multidrug transport system ATPase subunit [Akkermansiaceae bacterium]|jgi:ABC-type multidrug transport system ATPase subunit
MKSSPIGLQVEGLTIRQKGLTILNDLSLHLESGSLVALIGPSGAGKTTLLRTLGLRPPSRKNGDLGIVSTIEGEKATRISGLNHQALLEIISYVPQEDLFPEAAKVRETLEEALTFSGHDAEPVELLESVGLPPESLGKSVAKLSGGEKRRLSLARALCSQPRILLLDEPTSGLDLPVAIEVMQLLRNLCDKHHLTIVTTSHLPSTLKLCDRILVMEKGGRLKADYHEVAKLLDSTPETELFAQTTPITAIKNVEYLDSPATSLDWWNPRHFAAIFHRSARQSFRDYGAARVTIALPILLAGLIVFTQSLHGHNSPRFINFFLTIAALWIGMSLTIREIVSSRALYAIDELSGLGKFSYFHAKAAFAIFMVLVSTLLLCGAAWFFVWLFKIDPDAVAASDWFDARDFVSHFIVLGLVCFSGAMIGLLLSTIAKSERSAVSLMPIILLPHVLLSKYATGFAGEANEESLTHPFHSLDLERMDYSGFTWIEQGNFWGSVFASTRHGTSIFDQLGSSKFAFSSIFGLDFWALLILVIAQALLALIFFCYSANSSIRRIK